MKIAESLKKIIEKEGVTIYRVARAIGVDFSSLYKALKGHGNPEGKTIEKICEYLGYEIRFVKSKRKEVEPPGPSRPKRDLKGGGQYSQKENQG